MIRLQPLLESDLESLVRCGIKPEAAIAAGWGRVSSNEGARLLGLNGAGDFSGWGIPNYSPWRKNPQEVSEWTIRLDHPELESRPDGTTREKRKYLRPPGRNLLYIPPTVTPEELADAFVPIILCEGPKKALALECLAFDESGHRRFAPLGLAGVWGWRGKVGIESGPNGERQTVKGPLPEFQRIAWVGRAAYICFDSDRRTNESVRAAEAALAREIKGRGATVRILEVPELRGFSKTGVDDFLGHPSGGPAKFLQLFAEAREFEPDLLRLQFNDAGNAERIIALYGHRIRYCYPLKRHSSGMGADGLPTRPARP